MRVLNYLPPESISSMPRIVIYGSEKMLIEQHKGLLTYDNHTVCIKLPGNSIHISGNQLRIHAYTRDSLQIHGNISKVEFDL